MAARRSLSDAHLPLARLFLRNAGTSTCPGFDCCRARAGGLQWQCIGLADRLVDTASAVYRHTCWHHKSYAAIGMTTSQQKCRAIKLPV